MISSKYIKTNKQHNVMSQLQKMDKAGHKINIQTCKHLHVCKLYPNAINIKKRNIIKFG